MTLGDFLLARIAEDEKAARRAKWSEEGYSVYSYLHTYDAVHVALHDPARVMADCEARATILRMHVEGEAWCDHCEPPGGKPDECPTLRALALSYASHPDFLPEWRS